MRPLTVLLLVLGAIASLLFAVLSLMGDGGRSSAIDDGLVVRPPVHAAAPEADDSGLLAAPIERAEALTEIQGRVTVEASGAPTGDVGAQTGVLWGTVVDPNRNPVAGVQLSLIVVKGGPSLLGDGLHLTESGAPPLPVRQTKSDKAGGFRFDALAPGGDWTIVATHPDFVRKEVGPIDVPAEGGIEERITLEFGNLLTGRVVDALNGRPIAGARIVVENPLAAFLPSTRRQEGRLEVQTDENGVYAFKNLGTGQRALSVTAPGFATQYHANFTNTLQQMRQDSAEESTPGNVFATRKVRNPAVATPEAATPTGPITYDFALEPGKSIAGRVVGPDRAGIVDVEVLAINQTGTVGSRGSARTGAGGEFLIEDLGEGVYTLRAEASGYQATPVQRVEAGDAAVEIVMAEQGSVSGRVVDAATGKALTGFTCVVRAHHPRNISWGGEVARRVFRDRRDGSFTMTGVSEGEYVVEAFARGFASSFSEPFHVDQGIQTDDVLVRVTKGGTVKGRVIDSYSGDPIAGAVVSTNDNNFVDSEIMYLLGSLGSSATSKAKTTTNAKGEFVLELLTPDVYQVRIEKDGYTAVVLNDVNVADGVPTEMGNFSMLRGAIVEGVVYGPRGEPFPGASVTMHPAADNEYANTYQARTDANGHFRLKNAKAGDYKLSASRPMGPNSNPFAPVVDLRHSEIEITISDNGEYSFELHLGPDN